MNDTSYRDTLLPNSPEILREKAEPFLNLMMKRWTRVMYLLVLLMILLMRKRYHRKSRD